MANKEFQVRHGLTVNNTVLVANTITGNVGVGTNTAAYQLDVIGAANISQPILLVAGQNVLASFTSANNYAGAMANDAGTIANAAFNAANNRVAAVTSNNTSKIWANTVTVADIETVYVDLSTSGVTATTYGGSTNIPTFVVDESGRITSAANVAVTSGGLSVNNETSSASTFYPLFTTTTTGSASIANVSTSKLTFVPSTGTLSATVFNSLSDITFKTDVQDINNSIEILNSIHPVSFRWKDNNEKSYGVIAQELEKVLPELVATNDNVKSVSYDPLIAILINVVQKQQKEIEEIKKLLNSVVIRNQ